MKKLIVSLAAAVAVAGFAGCLPPVQCIRAIECVQTCGGPVLQSGCAACPSGTFDNWVCRDAGVDAATDVAPNDVVATDTPPADASAE